VKTPLMFCPICGDKLRITPRLRIRKHMNVNRKPLQPPYLHPYPICEASGRAIKAFATHPELA
jgi:hypothetical protein